jgi:hypothetical protein
MKNSNKASKASSIMCTNTGETMRTTNLRFSQSKAAQFVEQKKRGLFEQKNTIPSGHHSCN